MQRLLLRSMLVFLALGCILARPGSATVAIMSSDAELAQASRLIVQGEVRSVTAQWDGDGIFTYVEVHVGRVLKGRVAGKTIVVKQPGGTVGEITAWIHGAPRFQGGERVLLFLDTWSDGSLRVVHLFQGKYKVERDGKAGRPQAVRTAGGVPLLPRRTAGDVTQSADLTEFRRKIAGIVREQASASDPGKSAFVPFPREYRTPGRRAGGNRLGSATEPFTLAAIGGRFHRWFQPDSGQGVGIWFNLTQQPNGNAHAILQSGLDAWNNVPTSTIYLDFAGYNNAGGISRDFFNTISFEDPLSQIADPGSGCGGTVAMTGTWISTSSARVVNRTTFYQILESDIVYSNGRGPGPCPLFVNDSVIAQVAAHELGHAIGLGHSDVAGYDTTMRSEVQDNGRGSWLGLDDHVGANFIYPEPANPSEEASYYVGWHYRDWLQRDPESWGWAAWTNALNQCNGSADCTRPGIALGFIQSTEFFTSIEPRLNMSNYGTPAYNQAFVEECYERYWKRTLDSTYWVSWLNAQQPNNNDHYRAVVNDFITSDEYRSRFDPDLCNPYDEQACYQQGPGWSWNWSSCTCQYSYPDPCGLYGQYCL